jgi:hypothetical protein
MSSIYKRQLGKALYHALFWALTVGAVFVGNGLGLVSDTLLDKIGNAGQEYINLYSIGAT